MIIPDWCDNGIAPQIYFHGCHTYMDPFNSNFTSYAQKAADYFDVPVTGYSSLSRFSANENVRISVDDFSDEDNDVYLEPFYTEGGVCLPFSNDTNIVTIQPN